MKKMAGLKFGKRNALGLHHVSMSPEKVSVVGEEGPPGRSFHVDGPNRKLRLQWRNHSEPQGRVWCREESQWSLKVSEAERGVREGV